MGMLNRIEFKNKTKKDIDDIFADYIPNVMSNYEKRNLIYNYLVNNFTFDKDLFKKYNEIFKKKTNGHKNPSYEVKDTMINHKGIHHSLSIYYKFLLETVGIPSYYVTYHDEAGYIYGLNLVYDNLTDSFTFDDVTAGILNHNCKDYFDYELNKANQDYKQGNVEIANGFYWKIPEEQYFYVYLFENGKPKTKSKVVEKLISMRAKADQYLNHNEIAHDIKPIDTTHIKRRR